MIFGEHLPNHAMCVPVTISWRIIGLGMEETTSKYGSEYIEKKSRTTERGWSSRLGDWARG